MVAGPHRGRRLAAADLGILKSRLKAGVVTKVLRQENHIKTAALLARGIAVYNPAIDKTVQDVVHRADENMYKNKKKK